MTEYEVVVHTRVREIYSIEAESAEDAMERWSEGTMVMSECEYVDDVDTPVEVD